MRKSIPLKLQVRKQFPETPENSVHKFELKGQHFLKYLPKSCIYIYNIKLRMTDQDRRLILTVRVFSYCVFMNRDVLVCMYLCEIFWCSFVWFLSLSKCQFHFISLPMKWTTFHSTNNSVKFCWKKKSWEHSTINRSKQNGPMT